jgi:ABC-type glycerol-3-phosphate transport system substrate-binding protein
MKRRILAVLVAGAAVLALAACTTTKPTTQERADTAAQKLATQVVPAAIAGKDVTALVKSIGTELETTTGCKVVQLSGGPTNGDTTIEKSVRDAAAKYVAANPTAVVGIYFTSQYGAYAILDCTAVASATPSA